MNVKPRRPLPDQADHARVVDPVLQETDQRQSMTGCPRRERSSPSAVLRRDRIIIPFKKTLGVPRSDLSGLSFNSSRRRYTVYFQTCGSGPQLARGPRDG